MTFFFLEKKNGDSFNTLVIRIPKSFRKSRWRSIKKKTEELSKLICEEFNIEKNGPDYYKKFEFVFTKIFDQKIQLLEKIVVD